MSKFIKKLVVPTDQELFKDSHYLATWSAMKLITERTFEKPMTRRSLPTYMTITFAYLDHSGLSYSDGRPYHLPEFDSVFDDRPDFRSLSNFLETNENGTSYRRKCRNAERIRLIWIFTRLFPDIHQYIDITDSHTFLYDERSNEESIATDKKGENLEEDPTTSDQE